MESGVDALKALVGEMSAGQVSTLVMLGGNPAYTAPADVQFAANVAKVGNSIHLGYDPNETAAVSKWHLPEAHYLESWGDAVAGGVASIQQPMIEPIFGGRTASEIVALISGNKDVKAHDIVKNYWLSTWPEKGAAGKAAEKGDDAVSRDQMWRKSLHDGIVVKPESVKAAEASKLTADAKKVAAAVAAEPKPVVNQSGGGIEIGFVPSSQAWDGRFANNGWMQEAPDPMSKLVWGNAALMSVATAKDKGFKDGDMVSISKGGMKLEAAVITQPEPCRRSHHAVALEFRAHPLRTRRQGRRLQRQSDPLDRWLLVRLRIRHRRYRSDLSVRHHSRARPRRAHERPASLPRSQRCRLQEQPESSRGDVGASQAHLRLPGNQLRDRPPDEAWPSTWARCTGLQRLRGRLPPGREQPTPVVGKDRTYFAAARCTGSAWTVTMSARKTSRARWCNPCRACSARTRRAENVCPVAATTHSPEGLNDMVYNRCVGTRYCANNCPFKVRHFNFLNFHKNEPDIHSMVFNPDVTVRMRGVMEKCTYCVQRIQETKIKAKVDGRREIKDGEIKTACQQTCPADAIVFGNINDPVSKGCAKLKKLERQLPRHAGGAGYHGHARAYLAEVAQSQSGVGSMSVAVRQDPALLETNPPLVPGHPSNHELTEQISSIVEDDVFKTPLKYWIALGITSSVLVLLLCMLAYLAVTGIGVWGNNRPIGWAWDITNFVFWIDYRSRRHFDLGDSFLVPPAVAHFHQPFRRSHDAVRGHVRGDLVLCGV